jgi:succinate dehydrogenase / fumarate reductase, cytochrome b subunit
MSTVRSPFLSSLGKKYLMALTGLFLVSFLVVHLAGNLLLYKSAESFNIYSEFMATNVIIRVLEIGLVLGFGAHIIDGILLTIANRKARPEGYVKYEIKQTAVSFSRYMAVSGTIILAFLVVHLRSFTIEHRFINPGKETAYELVTNAFSTGWGGWYWLFYVVAIMLLGFHLNHGFQSAFQSLGFNHKRYSPILKKVGVGISALLVAGFISLPIYFRFIYNA